MSLLATLSKKAVALNESRFGVPFQALGPNGEWQVNDAVTGLPLRTMQIVGNTVKEDAITGEDVLIKSPNITISKTCLSPFPKAGENWLFAVPVSAEVGAELKQYSMSLDRIYIEDILGVATIYLMEVEQV